ncbi:MAG: acyl-CoA thioesterase [Mycobacteriales bacterium]
MMLEEGSVLDVLTLEAIDRDLYRAGYVKEEPYALYGGQVAAQAVLAAGLTVAPDRLPHSMHGYFLRRGDAARPTVFRVDRDRDGRSFSARRVVALQDGEVIFNMSASFQVQEAGPDVPSGTTQPVTTSPDDAEAFSLGRLVSFESRTPEQPWPGSIWPTRFWSRCTETVPDDQLLHACLLTYLSDSSSGLAPLADDSGRPGSSLDHALWYHRPFRSDQWLLADVVPHTASGGRGFYSGSFWQDGVLVATVTQEALFRAPARR